jgi:hypothetical protein
MLRRAVRRSIVTTLAITVLIPASLISPTSTTAAVLGVGTRATFTFLSEPDDHVGLGTSRWFDRNNATITVEGTSAEMQFSLEGGSQGGWANVWIGAPLGEVLQRRTYLDVMRTPFREPGYAGLDISADHRGCNTVSGILDVLDIQIQQGVLQRLWIRFEQHCGGDYPSPVALFGEIRIGMDPADAPMIAPTIVGWPDAYPNSWWHPVPSLRVLGPATGNDTVTHVAVGGPHRKQFKIMDDRCTGVTVSRSTPCDVDMRFNPDGGGPKYARLEVGMASGRTLYSMLQGRGIGGRTSVDFESDDGDYLGLGGTFHYDPSNSLITMQSANGNRVSGAATYWNETNDGPEFWGGGFGANFGETLVPGTTYDNATPSGNPYLEWTGQGRSCQTLFGKFTVEKLKLGSARTATVEYLKIQFEESCGSWNPAGLRGTIRYRLPHGDQSRPAAVEGLRAIRRGDEIVLTWTKPADDDLAAVVVRRIRGEDAPRGPLSGIHVYAGLGSKTTVDSPFVQSFSVYTLDTAGNVGPRRMIHVPAANR